MNIQSQRFGAVEFADDALLSFPGGVVGFPHERRFVLIPHKTSSYLAWLQSVSTAELAFPVVSAHAFGADYSDLSFVDATKVAEVGGSPEACAVMVVLCAPPAQPATVNLLAPIVVNLQTRQGAQVILEDSRYSTREPFVVVQNPERMPIAEPSAPALASGAL